MYFMSYLQSVSIAFRFYRYINFSTSAKHKKTSFLKIFQLFFFFGPNFQKGFLMSNMEKKQVDGNTLTDDTFNQKGQ